MKRTLISYAALMAMMLVGCEWPSARQTDDAEKQALEKRVAELEARLAATPTPVSVTDEATSETAPEQPSPQTRTKTTVRETSREPTAAPSEAPALEAAEAPVENASTPEPTLAPVKRVSYSIKDGSELTLVFETAVSTRDSKVGDSIVTRIERAMDADGRVYLPGGAVLEGRVSQVKGAARVGGKSFLAMTFNHLTVRGRRQSITPFTVQLQGGSDLKRDGAMVAGGTIAGAVVGGILGGNKGAKKGAALGAVGGAGAAVATKGETIELAPGAKLTVTVTRTARAHR